MDMKKFRFVVVLLLLSLVLTACGGSSLVTNFTVDMIEFTFTPSEVVVPAGQEITITANNNGAVVHEFVIMKLGETVGEDFGDEDEDNISWEVEVDPAGSKTVTFTAPSEPGTYQVVCGTEGHYIAGMVGSLTVAAP
jgi:uncharacterized cupredoxin-like copper-binding protein